jgi:hypothetical protein
MRLIFSDEENRYLPQPQVLIGSSDLNFDWMFHFPEGEGVALGGSWCMVCPPQFIYPNLLTYCTVASGSGLLVTEPERITVARPGDNSEIDAAMAQLRDVVNAIQNELPLPTSERVAALLNDVVAQPEERIPEHVDEWAHRLGDCVCGIAD